VARRDGSPSVGARRIPWLILGVVVVSALTVGARTGGAGSREDQVRAIAATIKCPQCPGQSSATSDAATATAVRTDIARRLEAGQSADRIRDSYVRSYGESVLLTPAGSGASGLVWAVPVAVVVLAFAALGFAFHRWRATGSAVPTDADRDLVVGAMQRSHVDAHGEGDGR